LEGTVLDLVADPADFSRQYGAIGEFGNLSNGVYRSMNSAEDWIVVNGPWTGLSGSSTGVLLASSPASPNTLYVVVESFSPQSFRFWRTDNAWDATPAW